MVTKNLNSVSRSQLSNFKADETAQPVQAKTIENSGQESLVGSSQVFDKPVTESNDFKNLHNQPYKKSQVRIEIPVDS